jgi:hypothetical protein
MCSRNPSVWRRSILRPGNISSALYSDRSSSAPLTATKSACVPWLRSDAAQSAPEANCEVKSLLTEYWRPAVNVLHMVLVAPTNSLRPKIRPPCPSMPVAVATPFSNVKTAFSPPPRSSAPFKPKRDDVPQKRRSDCLT